MSIPVGTSPAAKWRRATLGGASLTGRTNIALGAERPQELAEHGFFSASGNPVDMESFMTIKKETGAIGFRGPATARRAAPNGAGDLFSSSYPLAPVADGEVQVRPQPREPTRSVYFHPLGLSNLAESRRLLPGINSAIDIAAHDLCAEHEVGKDASLPRFRKEQNKAALWSDVQAAMRDIDGKTLQRTALWSGARATTPSARGLPGGRRKDMTRSFSSGRRPTISSQRDTQVMTLLTGAVAAPQPPSLVPELLELLSSKLPVPPRSSSTPTF